MDDLAPSRSLDNIFSQDDDAFLNMLFSNSSLNDAATSSSPAADDTLATSAIETSAPSSTPFFFNGDSTAEAALGGEETDVAPSAAVMTSSIDLPLLLPVKPELEEPLFPALPEIFPTIEDVGTPDSDELSDEMLTSSSSPIKAEVKQEGRGRRKTQQAPKKKKQVKVEDEKKKRNSKKAQDARPGKKQKVDNLTPFIRSLKGMDSMQLEEYASTRSLTAQQQAELKDWIRKIKNRESASNSRKNRKSHQQILEARLEDLDIRNEELQEEIKELEIENRVLRGELTQFRALIERSNLGQAFEQYNRLANKLSASNNDSSSTTTATTTSPSVQPIPTPIPSPPSTTTTTAQPTSGNFGVSQEELVVTSNVAGAATELPTTIVDNDASAIATPTAVLPTGTKDQIESYRAQTLARLGEAVSKMVQKGKARREDVALVLYLLIVLHQCGQFLTTGQMAQQQAQQLPISASSEAISVVV